MKRHTVFVRTRKGIMPTEEAVERMIQRCIKQGYYAFICTMETEADLMIVEQVKRYPEQAGVILIDTEDSLPMAKEEIYKGCDVICRLDDFIKAREEREEHLYQQAYYIVQM